MNSKEYSDCIFPRDIFKLDINKDIILDILLGNSDEIADSLKLQYNTRNVLDLHKYRLLLIDNMHCIILKYSFYNMTELSKLFIVWLRRKSIIIYKYIFQ